MYICVCNVCFCLATNSTKSIDQLKVLDSRKAYNICKEILNECVCVCLYYTCSVCEPLFPFLAILLGHLRVSYDDVRRAVFSCNTHLLSIERLQQMEKYAPDKKEVYIHYYYHHHCYYYTCILT